MKKPFYFLLLIPLSAFPAWAAISIDIQVGTLRDATSNPVSDGSVWAVIVDEDDNDTLPGGLTVTTSSSLTALHAPQTYADFAGKTIQADAMINGDKILQTFFVDGENTSGMPSLSIQTIVLTDAQWTSLSDKNWGIYWFPGITSLTATLPNSSFQVGGIRETDAGSGGDLGMVIPTFVDNSTQTRTAAFLDNSTEVGGDIVASRFTAINAIPEPSAMVLTLLGSAALLRRRRA